MAHAATPPPPGMTVATTHSIGVIGCMCRGQYDGAVPHMSRCRCPEYTDYASLSRCVWSLAAATAKLRGGRACAATMHCLQQPGKSTWSSTVSHSWHSGHTSSWPPTTCAHRLASVRRGMSGTASSARHCRYRLQCTQENRPGRVSVVGRCAHRATSVPRCRDWVGSTRLSPAELR